MNHVSLSLMGFPLVTFFVIFYALTAGASTRVTDECAAALLNHTQRLATQAGFVFPAEEIQQVKDAVDLLLGELTNEQLARDLGRPLLKVPRTPDEALRLRELLIDDYMGRLTTPALPAPFLGRLKAQRHIEMRDLPSLWPAYRIAWLSGTAPEGRELTQTDALFFEFGASATQLRISGHLEVAPGAHLTEVRVRYDVGHYLSQISGRSQELVDLTWEVLPGPVNNSIVFRAEINVPTAE